MYICITSIYIYASNAYLVYVYVYVYTHIHMHILGMHLKQTRNTTTVTWD